MSHPSTATLDLYVMNAIDNKAEVLALEHHLAGCGTCKGILGEAAAFEIELSELASQVIFCIACDQVRVDQDSRCHECGAVASAGGFTIDELLVKNAHGRLYRAHDQNGRQVALKELAFVQTPGPQVLAAFEREAQFLRALNHPRIPKFVASFSEGSGVQTRLYLAQEFIDGSSLQTSLSDSWFDEDKIRAIAMQVLDILVYLQGLSPIVVHRDIKPANLIRREDGELVLVDFGAAHDPAETMGLTFAGTFGYMPVEQLAGTVDETTDVFALGQSLKHLLTRREPWKLTEPDALDAANVSLSLRAFLEKLTANNPAERFPGAAAAMVALKELGSGKLVKLAKSKQTEPKRGFVRRWGSRAALVATGRARDDRAGCRAKQPPTSRCRTRIAVFRLCQPLRRPVQSRDQRVQPASRRQLSSELATSLEMRRPRQNDSSDLGLHPTCGNVGCRFEMLGADRAPTQATVVTRRRDGCRDRHRRPHYQREPLRHRQRRQRHQSQRRRQRHQRRRRWRTH